MMKRRVMGLIAVAVLMCCHGCVTPSGPKQPELQMATATHLFKLTGAQPIRQDGAAFYYRAQCLACGAAAAQQSGTSIPKGTSTLAFEYKCPECGSTQTIRISITERAQ